MKKIWKMTILWGLALCLLAGCGAPAAQPEYKPLAPPVEQSAPNQPAVPTDPVTPGEPIPAPVAPGQPTAPTEPSGGANQTSPAEPPAQVLPEVDTPAPVPPEQAEITDTKLTCTLEIRCDKLVGNAELDPHKVELIPDDGVLFAAADVEFFEGESVFNVLQRTLKQNKQHLEFAQSPLYNSAYIEGICNLYQFDCGNLSGWMYRVNDWYPNYGCSQYALQAGDVIVWDYTCDLGADLGVEDSTGNNQ